MSKLTRLIALFLVLTLVMAACVRQAPDAAPAEVEAESEVEAEEAEDEAEEEPAESDEETAEEAVEEESAEESAEMTEVGPIKIGFMGPLTGGAAFIGVEMLGFAQAVAAIYSEQTGFDIQIVEGDTEINPDTGSIVAERFVADETIVGVVGPAGSQVCEATQPIFEGAGLVHMTPSCTKTDLTQPGTATFFRPIPTDADQSKTVVDFMLNELGVTSAFLVDDQSSYSVGLNDEVEALLLDAGITEIERASVTQEETDFSSVVTAVTAAGSDVLFFPSQIASQEGTMAVQLREQGFEGTYFLPDGGFNLDWIEMAGESANGAFVSFFAPDPNLVPDAAEMNARYVEESGEGFGAFGGASGFTTQILIEAAVRCAEAGDISRACVLAETAATNMDNTVLGIPVSFGEGNQAEGSAFFLFQVQDGAFELVSKE